MNLWVSETDGGDPEIGSVASLLLESHRLLRSDPERALWLARQAYSIAGEQGDIGQRAGIHYAIGLAHRMRAEYAEALDWLERAKALFDASGDRRRLSLALNEIGWAHLRSGDSGKGLESFRQALDCLDDRSSPEWRKIQSSIATTYRLFGAYEKALPIFLHLIEYYSSAGEGERLAVAYDNLGCMCGELGDLDMAIPYLLRSIETARGAGYRYGEATALSNLGAAYNGVGEWKQALEQLYSALDIYEQIQSNEGITRVLHSIGESFESQGNAPQALKHYRRAIRFGKACSNRRSCAYSTANIGRIQAAAGSIVPALKSYKHALALAESVGDVKLQYQTHQAMAGLHEELGDLANALAHYRRFMEIKDAVSGEQARRTIAEMQARFNFEQAERDRELYRLKSEQLERELQFKNSELTAMALRLLERSNESSGDWDWFERQFRQVHPDYVQHLSERFPLLSPTELRICALLKINLVSKEIARLLHVSVRDIENHRYRIRRKLDISSETNLSSFLAAI